MKPHDWCYRDQEVTRRAWRRWGTRLDLIATKTWESVCQGLKFKEIIFMFYLQFRWCPEAWNVFVNGRHMSLFPQCLEYDQSVLSRSWKILLSHLVINWQAQVQFLSPRSSPVKVQKVTIKFDLVFQKAGDNPQDLLSLPRPLVWRSSNEDHLKVPDSEHDQSLAATPSSSAIREA